MIRKTKSEIRQKIISHYMGKVLMLETYKKLHVKILIDRWSRVHMTVDPDLCWETPR